MSRWGRIAFASSLDQAGPLGLSAADCALMLQAMAGHDEKDSTCLNEPVDDYLGALDQSVDGLKIGVPEEFFPDNLDGAIADNAREAMRELEKQGAKLVKLSLPSIKLSVPAYYVIAPAEASSNLSRFDGVRFGYSCEDPKDLEDLYKRSRSEGFGAEVKRRIRVGTYALSDSYYDAYYKRAKKVRRLIRDDFSRAFKDVDVIMGPTSPETAFKLGAKADDPVNMDMADELTIAVNLAGRPARAMPRGSINARPAGPPAGWQRRPQGPPVRGTGAWPRNARQRGGARRPGGRQPSAWVAAAHAGHAAHAGPMQILAETKEESMPSYSLCTQIFWVSRESAAIARVRVL